MDKGSDNQTTCYPLPYPRHLLTVSRAVTVPLPLLTCSLRSPAERSGSGEERTTTRSQEVTEGSTGDGNHVDSSWTVYPLSVPLTARGSFRSAPLHAPSQPAAVHRSAPWFVGHPSRLTRYALHSPPPSISSVSRLYPHSSSFPSLRYALSVHILVPRVVATLRYSSRRDAPRLGLVAHRSFPSVRPSLSPPLRE